MKGTTKLPEPAMYAIATAKAKKLAEGGEDEATVYANKAYKWGKKGTTFPTPQLADLWRAVRQAYIDGGKGK